MAIHNLSVKYASSENSDQTLYAAFIKTGNKPKPILVYLHGWYGNRYYVQRDLGENQFILKRFFLIGVDMRGRGSTGREAWWGEADPERKGKDGPISDGFPDANGWELNDIIDAIEMAKSTYPQHVLPETVYVIGHSGGGGNVMGLLGKFPDFFTAAYAGSGMSDYKQWAELAPCWRPSIEKFIGAKLKQYPQAFVSRGGLTTVVNRLTPVALSHGDKDESVPLELSKVYIDKNARLGKPVPFRVFKGVGHGAWGHYKEIVSFLKQYSRPPVIPEKGKFAIAGYIKTNRFQIILPSIDSITNCDYAFSNSLNANLSGGLSGKVKLRLPPTMTVDSVKCRIGEKILSVTASKWNCWTEYNFDYSSQASIKVKSKGLRAGL